MYTQMCSSVQNMIHGTFTTQFGKILAELPKSSKRAVNQLFLKIEKKNVDKDS